MVIFSSRISPFTSTVIFLERSPFATAVVTAAMFRTWAVRLPAIELTESVRSFHVPATPFTFACPPSFPSVPTSRATRVTSDANDRSWSTMVLMVSLSSKISPRTSTVIFLDRSPFATAVVTAAMFLTWAVRLPAIEFTESVRSFHVPATPVTFACPPSFPSVPTSRATRVTSDANDPSCATIVLTVLAVRRNSPSSGRPSMSSAIVCERSPFATAPITRAVSLVGCTRSLTSALTEFTVSAHEPVTLPIAARCEIFPSLPTTRLMRSSSLAIRSFSSTTALNASAIFPSIPAMCSGRRTENTPRRKAVSAARRSLRSSPSGWDTRAVWDSRAVDSGVP